MGRNKDQETSRREVISELVQLVKGVSAGRKDRIDVSDLKKRFNLLLLDKVYRKFERKGNGRALLEVLELPAKRWERIVALIRHFRDFLPGAKKANRDQIFQYLVTGLGEFTNFKVTRVNRTDVPHLFIEFLNPPLECLQGDILFFPTQGEVPLQEMQSFVNIIESLPPEYLRKAAFILATEDEEELRQLARESRYKFVLLTSRNLSQIVLAEAPQIELNSQITSQLDLLDIQPYRTHGSTPSMMFFGRKREIDWMLNNPHMSVAIYGGRQLGKTSLLRRIQERLDEEKGKETVFVTCEGISDNLLLGLEIFKQLGLDTSKIKSLADFELHFRDYLRKKKIHLNCFIDEVDDLVDHDRESEDKIFVTLRNIQNDFPQKCRFFFAGFKKLYAEFYRLYAPFRNFAEPYELGSLNKKDARKLIEEPLCRRLGLKFQSKRSITEKIFEYTGGHPCFIQHYCKCLIERVAEDGRQFITNDDVEEVYQSEAYRNLIIGNYSDNFREGEERGDILPKLLIGHIIFEDMESFTENQLLTSLKKAKIKIEPFQLRTELKKLTMTSVLEKIGSVYRFTNSVYPQILKENENLADILIQLMEEYEEISTRETKVQPLREPAEEFILREGILSQIVADSEKSYAMVGGKGFGKTSVLKQLEELYEYDISYRPLFCSAGDLANGDELLGQILAPLGMGAGGRDEKMALIKELIAEENHQHSRRIVFIIDDVDGPIEEDSSGVRSLLQGFEAFSSEFDEGFRLILGGGSQLYSMVKDSPFKSIVTLHLRPLDERDARELLNHLFKSHGGLMAKDQTLIDFILEVAGGNPQILERFCRELEERVDRNRITEVEIEAILEEESFRLFLLDTYEDGWNQKDHKVVREIIEMDRRRFTARQLAKSSQWEARDLKDVISRLNLLGLLKRTGRYYRFTNPYYKECYRWRQKKNS